jgi:hypothetical protein
MATLPRSSSRPAALAASTFARHQSEFDAGINASHAWTEHLDRGSDSLSDEEPEVNGADDGDDEDENRPARALYDFEGKPEFRELTVAAGEEILVIKEDLADGWSLVKNDTGELGLLPRTYYTVWVLGTLRGGHAQRFGSAVHLPTRSCSRSANTSKDEYHDLFGLGDASWVTDTTPIASDAPHYTTNDG